jgi:hypothetical protein
MKRSMALSRLAVLWLAASLCGVSLFAVPGCGSSAVINTRHEELGTLAGRSTYAFTDLNTVLNDEGFSTGHLFNSIMQRRICDELSRELAKRGYTQGPEESASLLVTFSTGNRQDVVTQGDQKGPVVQGPAYAIDRGALVLHFLDSKTKAVLWRGWGDGIMKPDDDLDEKVRAAVREIMSAFPSSKS